MAVVTLALPRSEATRGNQTYLIPSGSCNWDIQKLAKAPTVEAIYLLVWLCCSTQPFPFLPCLIVTDLIGLYLISKNTVTYLFIFVMLDTGLGRYFTTEPHPEPQQKNFF